MEVCAGGSGTLRFVNIFSYALITGRQINLALHKTQRRAQGGRGRVGKVKGSQGTRVMLRIIRVKFITSFYRACNQSCYLQDLYSPYSPFYASPLTSPSSTFLADFLMRSLSNANFSLSNEKL